MTTDPRYENRRGLPEDRVIAERLRECRLLTGRSMPDVADAIGISYQQLQKYEAGRNRVSASRLKQLAIQYDRPYAYFLGDLDDDRLRAARLLGWLREFGPLLAACAPLAPENRRAVLETATELARRHAKR